MAAKRMRRMQPFQWEPLTMTWSEVAFSVFRSSELWLREHAGEYPDFPEPKDGLFHAGAVRSWCDRHWGVVRPAEAANDSEVEDILLARVRDRGQSKNPASRRAAA